MMMGRVLETVWLDTLLRDVYLLDSVDGHHQDSAVNSERLELQTSVHSLA